ncbi:MAG: glycine betaine ABC transporter substrate-binding protein [Mycobacterium sp.]|jgi:glycine betaine/choline ABC-type transport system substrate-binding protein
MLRVLPRLVALVAVLLAGCGGEAPPPRSVSVGASAESSLLAHLYAAALRYYGSPAHVKSTPDPLGALDSGDIDVAPAFTGEVLTRFAPDAAARSAAQVYRVMVGSLPEGLGAGDYAEGASDKPAVAVTGRTASDWRAGDVTALIQRCTMLKPGAVKGSSVPDSFGTCMPARPREFADDTALWAALRSGKVDIAWTSAAVPDFPEDLAMLADRTALIRAENVVPVFRRNTLSQPQLRSINELAGVLDTDALAQMRAEVAAGAEPGAVANAWLDAHPLGH